MHLPEKDEYGLFRPAGVVAAVASLMDERLEVRNASDTSHLDELTGTFIRELFDAKVLQAWFDSQGRHEFSDIFEALLRNASPMLPSVLVMQALAFSGQQGSPSWPHADGLAHLMVVDESPTVYILDPEEPNRYDRLVIGKERARIPKEHRFTMPEGSVVAHGPRAVHERPVIATIRKRHLLSANGSHLANQNDWKPLYNIISS